MVNAIACTIELWMHLGGLLSTQEARVAYFVLSKLPRASITQYYTLWRLPFVNLPLGTSRKHPPPKKKKKTMMMMMMLMITIIIIIIIIIIIMIIIIFF